MKYLIDTDICIYLIKKRSEYLFKKFRSMLFNSLAISSVSLAELRYGAQKSEYPQKNHAALEEFILPLEVISFDRKSVFHYAHIRTHLEKKGMIIGPYDLMIAAQALSLNMTLVTNNEKEYIRVPELKIENWTNAYQEITV